MYINLHVQFSKIGMMRRNTFHVQIIGLLFQRFIYLFFFYNTKEIRSRKVLWFDGRIPHYVIRCFNPKIYILVPNIFNEIIASTRAFRSFPILS